MATSLYPGALDGFNENRVTEPNRLVGPDVDGLAAAMNRVQAELGVNPSGAAATVAALIAAAAPLPTITAGGLLGAASTLALGGLKEVWLTGTLTANLAITVTGLTVGAKFRLLFAQDATGGRTLAINDGTGAVAVAIPLGAFAGVIVSGYFDGTDLFVEAA